MIYVINRNSKTGAIAPTKSPCLSQYITPRTTCITPWAPEKPLFLAAHRLRGPDGQKHTLQLTATDVKVVNADQCVAME